MNIILIGPVSGDVERAKLVFAEVEKAATIEGDTVVHNPMRDHVTGHSEAWYMKQSLTKICDLVDAKTPNLLAVLLEGWQESYGAFAEVALCNKLRITYTNLEWR